MKTYSIRKIVTSAVLPLAVSVPLWAGAADYSETYVTSAAAGVRTYTVSVADLNLATAAGRETARQRISRAAKVVCGTTDYRQAGSLHQVAANRSCQQRALADAMAQMPADRQVATLGD
jgi:UrcA family protein